MRLKNIFLLMIAASAFASCSKEKNVDIGCCTPVLPKTIIKDSIETGNKYGVTIGDNKNKVYTDFQLFAKDRNYESITISQPAFTKIEDIKDLIDSYSSIAFNGVKFKLSDGKVSSITTSAGTNLTEWPTGFSTTVQVNDPVTSIYNKLVTISNRVNYSHLFNQIFLENKLVQKPIDDKVKASNKWSFRYQLADKEFEYVEFRFSNGNLSSIFFQNEKY